MGHRVLVTDAGQRKAVPIMRALGRKGVYVAGGEAGRFAMGFYSRYCRAHYIYPAPEHEEEFITWLIQQAKEGSFDILFPIDERTMTPVTRNLNELTRYMRIPVVNYDTYLLARDKQKTMAVAGSLNIPIPRTWWYSSWEEFQSKKDEVEVPCVIKPRMSSGSRGLKYVHKKEELVSSYALVHQEYPQPLIQEMIPAGGDSFGVELILDHGEVKAFFMHRRLREYPVSGGPSTLRESVNDPELIRQAICLVSQMGWHGVAMVEFKVDPRDGVPRLMEINPKFWGSVALPIFCGVDFPHMLYQLSLGEKVETGAPYPTHVRCRWLIPGDLLHFLANPHRFRLKPSFFDFRGEHEDLLDLRDPGPMLGMLLSFAVQVFDKDFRKKHLGRAKG